MSKRRISNTYVPDYELDSLARTLYDSVISYCLSEKGRSEYEKWKQEQKQLNNANLIDNTSLKI